MTWMQGCRADGVCCDGDDDGSAELHGVSVDGQDFGSGVKQNSLEQHHAYIYFCNLTLHEKRLIVPCSSYCPLYAVGRKAVSDWGKE